MVRIADLLAVLRLQDEMTPEMVAAVGKAVSSLQALDKQAQLTAYKITLFGRGLTEAGTIATAIFTVPILAAAEATIKFGSEFQTQMTRVVTLAGASTEEVASLRQGVLDLGLAVGVGPDKLAQGLFVLESYGLRGAAAMDALTVAAKMSALGMGETSEIARGLTGVLFAYKDQNLSAAQAGDILTKTVQLGNMKINELVPAMAKINPVAAAMGIKIQDVAAAMATFTHAGVDSSVAATGIRAALSNILNDSAKTEKGFLALRNATKDTSITMDNFKNSIAQKGFTSAMEDLVKKADTTTEGMKALNSIFPNIRALTEILAVYHLNGEMVVNTLHELNNATGTVDNGTKELAKTFQQQLNIMNVAIQELWIKLSDSLIPAFQDLMKIISASFPIIQGLIDVFNKMPESVQLATIGLLGFVALLGPTMLVAGQLVQAYGNISRALTTIGFASITGALEAVLVPLGLFVSALVLVGGVVYELHEKMGNWRDVLLTLAVPFGPLLVGLDSLAEKLGINTKLFHDIAAILRDVVIIAWNKTTDAVREFAAKTMVYLELAGEYIKNILLVTAEGLMVLNPTLGRVVTGMLAEFAKLPGALEIAGKAVGRTREVMDGLAGVQKEVVYSNRDLVDGAQGVAGQMGGVTSAAMAAAVAQQTLLAAVAALTAEQKSAIEAGKAHGLTAKQIQQNMEALGIGIGSTAEIIGIYERQTNLATTAANKLHKEVEKGADAYDKARDHLKVITGLQDDFFKVLNKETSGEQSYLSKILGADTNARMNDLDRAVTAAKNSGLLIGDAFKIAAQEAGKLSAEGIKLTPQLYQIAIAAGELGPKVKDGLAGLDLNQLGTKVDTNAKGIIAYFDLLSDKANSYGKTIAILSTEFVKLSQISSGSLGAILKNMGALFTQLEAANKLTQQKGTHVNPVTHERDIIGGNWGVGSVLAGEATTAEKAAAAIAGAGAIVNGAMNVWEAAMHSATKATGIFNSTMAGMQAGAAFGPWGAAIGAGVGALTGWIASMSAGRRAVEDFAKSFGGFDQLHQKLLDTLGSVGEDFWVQLTQRIAKGDKAGADALIKTIQTAIANSASSLADAAGYKTIAAYEDIAKKAKDTYDYMVKSGKYSASEIAKAYDAMSKAVIDAMDDTQRATYDAAVAARDEAKKMVDQLDGQIKSLQDSISKEAPEEFMGLIEQSERAQLESLKKQRADAQTSLDAAEQQIKDAVDAAISGAAGAMNTTAQQTADAIRERIESATYHIKVDAEVTGLPNAAPMAAGGDFLVTKPTLFLAGEAGPERASFSGANKLGGSGGGGGPQTIIVKTYLDGRQIAEAVVPEIPRIVQEYGLT